jgi:hypothetical protein
VVVDSILFLSLLFTVTGGRSRSARFSLLVLLNIVVIIRRMNELIVLKRRRRRRKCLMVR